MKPEHFHYLLEIDRYHSISAAAKALHIKQNTLSAIVKSVEDELGFHIFQRAPNGVVTTAEGERLMATAWEIHVKYEELLSLKNYTTSMAQAVHLLLCPSINIGLPIPLSQRYYRFELHGDLIFEELPRLEIDNAIRQNAANLGITYLSKVELQELRELTDHGDIEITVLLEDRFYLVTAKKTPEHETSDSYKTNMEPEYFATVTTFGAANRRYVPKNISKGCSRVISFSNTALMKQAILQHNMIGVLTGFALHQDMGRPSSLYQITPMEDENFPKYVCMLRRKGRGLRYQERVLSSCIIEYFQELSDSPLLEGQQGGDSECD